MPYHDALSHIAVEKFIAKYRWDVYLNLGDFIDFDSISSFSEGRPRLVNGKSINRDIAEANKILDRHQAIIRKRNPKAKFVILEGNHEERTERFLDVHPQFEGLLDVPTLLHLKDRGFEWVPSWTTGKPYTIGKASFIHGTSSTGKYHVYKMADDYGDNIFCGHSHDMMCIPKASKLHPDKVIVGQSIGCLCTDMPYMKGRPSKWQQGFAVFYFQPDGSFTYYTPRIFNHKFIGPDGILYTP